MANCPCTRFYHLIISFPACTSDIYFDRIEYHASAIPLNECLFVCELFSTFTASCAIMHPADIQKVFSHVLSGKCGSFSITTGQRTALISCLEYGRDVFCVSIPHIYSSVGYCVVYCCYWSFHNHPLDKRNQLHTFFYGHTEYHLGVEW